MKRFPRKYRNACLAAVALAMTAILASCSFSWRMNGTAINYDVYKTINVSEFPIRAALVYPPLQQTFENQLLDYVTRNPRLQEVDGPADLELSGEITVGTDAYATETRLTITVRVKYTDNKNPAKNMDQSFSAYRQFSSDLMLTDVQDDLCREISEELVNLIFNATLGDW